MREEGGQAIRSLCADKQIHTPRIAGTAQIHQKAIQSQREKHRARGTETGRNGESKKLRKMERTKKKIVLPVLCFIAGVAGGGGFLGLCENKNSLTPHPPHAETQSPGISENWGRVQE